MAFDLERFRELAFWRPALPDHPMRTLAEASRLLGLLPDDDPYAALADLTHWTAGMNATPGFTRGRRARILMLLDEAARPFWRMLASRYLAPEGRPAAGRDGDPRILHALLEIAAEFQHGFAIALDAGEGRSKWADQNAARLFVRKARWLGRRITLTHMLRRPEIGELWTQLHRLHADAIARQAARIAVAAFEGDRHPSSPTQEYLRQLLLELADPESLSGRQIELAYRVAHRVAAHARLEEAHTPECAFAVVPAGDARPGPAEERGPNAVPAPVYISTTNVLPRLRALRERDMGREPGEPDTVFGADFTVAERLAMLDRLLDYWGLDAPRRRAKRIAMASTARVHSGFDKAVTLLTPLANAWRPGPGQLRQQLQIELADTTGTLTKVKLQAGRVAPARVADASTGGLGIVLPRAEAVWAAQGALVSVMVEPSSTWILAVVRRLSAEGKEMRLGLQVLSRNARTLWIRPLASERASVWSEAMVHEASFREKHKRAILLEQLPVPLPGGEILLPPKLASRGTQLDVLLPSRAQRIQVDRIVEENAHFQRAIYESLGVRAL